MTRRGEFDRLGDDGVVKTLHVLLVDVDSILDLIDERYDGLDLNLRLFLAFCSLVRACVRI